MKASFYRTPPQLITFSSDFGDHDWFVAAVKGEILKINRNALIIDITHRINQYDIRSAAFLLKSVFKNFPLGTIHLAVVDPGVGSERKPIIVQTGGYCFVGPDNGIFSYVCRQNSKVYMINVRKKSSSTFQARDVFGPIAARITLGSKPEDLGARIKRCLRFEFPVVKISGKRVFGEVIYIDQFGNLITNISNNVDLRELSILGKRISVKDFYGAGKSGEIIGVRGSAGYYEIACHKRSVRQHLKVETGCKIVGRT